MSSRTMDAENHTLLLTSSPAYNSFLENTENYTLPIQHKYQLLLFITSPSPRASPSPTSPSPTSPSPTSPSPTSPSNHVPESHVPESHVPESYIPESPVPEPTPHVPVLTSQSPRPSPHVTVPIFVTAVDQMIFKWTIIVQPVPVSAKGTMPCLWNTLICISRTLISYQHTEASKNQLRYFTLKHNAHTCPI